MSGYTFHKAAVATTFAVASLAKAPFSAQAVDFTGNYADSNHPNCLRQVEVIGTKASISGTDGTPGCPAAGTGKTWKLLGSVKDDKIFVDFSPKGGPADLEGKWEAKPIPGILWPDGNLWSSKISPN